MLCEQFHPRRMFVLEKQWLSVYINLHQCQQQAAAKPTPICRQTKGKSFLLNVVAGTYETLFSTTDIYLYLIRHHRFLEHQTSNWEKA